MAVARITTPKPLGIFKTVRNIGSLTREPEGDAPGRAVRSTTDDIEDEGEVTFLKIRSGKDAEFRCDPISRRLSRELVRYLNRWRLELRTELCSSSPKLGRCVRSHCPNSSAASVVAVASGFGPTSSVTYTRLSTCARVGEIERLRRILGHTTYVMVMRYVHLDKGDLAREVDLQSPF